jgi:NTP pyrophosphatase (non-canonical NTP hydrolase)
VAEEMGELAHAVLKQSQGIRGTREDHDADMRDAIGDIVIYLAGLCSAKGWDLDKIVETTAYEVMRRDWVTDPLRGAPE